MAKLSEIPDYETSIKYTPSPCLIFSSVQHTLFLNIYAFIFNQINIILSIIFRVRIYAMYEYSSVEFAVLSMYCLSMSISMHFLMMEIEGTNRLFD